MNKVLGIILLLLSYNNFAEENIYNFMLKNNMEYPYNIETNINDSRYIDRSDNVELDKNGYIVPSKLTNKQKEILAHFFERLKLISEPQYFSELKNQNDIIAFSIQNINLHKDNSDYEFIGVSIKYYSNKKLETCPHITNKMFFGKRII
jgi:hypothetical protein